MSQDWDFYFLRVDDKPASIFVDLGLANEAPLERFPYMAYVQLQMNAPRADGLSSREEFDSLKTVEGLFERALSKPGDTMYVGRNTSNGCRDFYFYTANADNWEHRVSRVMEECDSYQFTCGSRHDPEWETYFGFLYPSEIDRQRIENRRVCDALEREGDTLSQEREIDHWAYSPTPTARAAFIRGPPSSDFWCVRGVTLRREGMVMVRKSTGLISLRWHPLIMSHYLSSSSRRTLAASTRDGRRVWYAVDRPLFGTLLFGFAILGLSTYLYVSHHINSPTGVGYEKLWDWQVTFFLGMLLPILLVVVIVIVGLKLLSRYLAIRKGNFNGS